ncbi:MAG: Ig-like domain repeat protein, partial [Verrucomicrobia bacterium]|nr:Ig-like domain repeat protein [Verrucomicrobiota bacterium]
MRTQHSINPARSALKHSALALATAALMGTAQAQLPVINGLQCWFDASQGVTTSGTNVTGWADQSGNGNSTTGVNGTPKFAASQVNGRPAVLFQGGNNNLKIDHNIIPQQEYIVFKSGNYARDAANPNQWGGDWGGPFGQQNDNGWMFQSGTRQMWGDGSRIPLAVSQNGTAIVQNNANGNPYGMANVANYMILKVNPRNYASAYARIGRPNNSWGNGYFDVAEVIVYNRLLSTAEENQIGGYLTTKYGLTAVSAYTPLPLMMRLDSPFDGQGFISGATVTASATVVSPLDTSPYTVKFFTNIGGGVAQVGSDQIGAGPTFTQSLGAPGDGSYQVFASVTDSAGTPVTVDSATNNFTLAPAAATTTTLSATTTSTYGQNATLTATVAAATTPNGGTVQFYDDNGVTPLGSPVAINTSTGVASYTTNTLVAGTHKITATYSGYGIYLTSSTSGSTDQVVTQAVLNVTADNKVRSPGTDNPALTYQISGYQLGQTFATSGVSGTPTLACVAVPSDPVGNYPITVDTSPMTAANYSFNGVAGNLKVMVGAPPVVAANVLCWYDAGQGVTTSGSNVTAWDDSSGNAHQATRGGGTVTYVASDTQIAKPAVHLRSGGFMNCALSMTAGGAQKVKEQYVVLRSGDGKTTWSGGSFLGRMSNDFLTVRASS